MRSATNVFASLILLPMPVVTGLYGRRWAVWQDNLKACVIESHSGSRISFPAPWKCGCGMPSVPFWKVLNQLWDRLGQIDLHQFLCGRITLQLDVKSYTQAAVICSALMGRVNTA